MGRRYLDMYCIARLDLPRLFRMLTDDDDDDEMVRGCTLGGEEFLDRF